VVEEGGGGGGLVGGGEGGKIDLFCVCAYPKTLHVNTHFPRNWEGAG
jgi:hypothetical protein